MILCSTCGVEVIKAGRCSDCNKVYMKEYRSVNLEKVKEGQRDHYKRNAEKIKNKVNKYRIENSTKIKTSKANHYDKNKEEIRKRIKNWQNNNLNKVKEIQRTSCLNRVARKKKAEGRHTIEDIRKLYDIQLGFCVVCKRCLLKGYHVDHKTPLSKGGSNWPANLQLLCPSCNCQKQAMTMEEFMKRRNKI